MKLCICNLQRSQYTESRGNCSYSSIPVSYTHLDVYKRQGEESFKNFDLAAFAKKTFGMYGGVDAEVTLECRNELAGVVTVSYTHLCIYELLKKKKFSWVMVGGKYRISKKSFDEWLDQHQ